MLRPQKTSNMGLALFLESKSLKKEPVKCFKFNCPLKTWAMYFFMKSHSLKINNIALLMVKALRSFFTYIYTELVNICTAFFYVP